MSLLPGFSFLGLLNNCRAAGVFLGLCVFAWCSQAQVPSESKWYTAARLNGGLVMDPMMPLAHCEASIQKDFLERFDAIAPSGDFWTLYPASLPNSVTQSQALSELQRTPMWVVDEKGSRLVRWSGLVGAPVRSNGPCFHLSTFSLKDPQRFRLSEDSDVLVTSRAVASSTRLVRARSPMHQSFASNEYNPRFERPLMQWITEQPALLRTILAELPRPADGVDRELCVPSHQPFNATVNGALAALVSVRVQWCECAQRVGSTCSKPLDPRGSQPQWLGVVDRRSGSNLISLASPASAVQLWTVIALATGSDLREDVIWILEEYPKGVASSVLLREGAAFKRKQISSYSGL